MVLRPRKRRWFSDSLPVKRFGDRIPAGGELFLTRPDRPLGPTNLLYKGYRVSFPGIKWPGRGVENPPKSSAEVKGGIELS